MILHCFIVRENVGDIIMFPDHYLMETISYDVFILYINSLSLVSSLFTLCKLQALYNIVHYQTLSL